MKRVFQIGRYVGAVAIGVCLLSGGRAKALVTADFSGSTPDTASTTIPSTNWIPGGAANLAANLNAGTSGAVWSNLETRNVPAGSTNISTQTTGLGVSSGNLAGMNGNWLLFGNHGNTVPDYSTDWSHTIADFVLDTPRPLNGTEIAMDLHKLGTTYRLGSIRLTGRDAAGTALFEVVLGTGGNLNRDLITTAEYATNDVRSVEYQSANNVVPTTGDFSLHLSLYTSNYTAIVYGDNTTMAATIQGPYFTNGTLDHIEFHAWDSKAEWGIDNIILADASLSVNSIYGSPTPDVGLHFYDSGTIVTASVARIVTNSNATIVECTGWYGTGDVPATGTTNQIIVALNNNSSTINWLWKTNEVYLDIVAAPGVTTDVTSAFHPFGSSVTVTATPTNVVWQGDTDNCTISNNVITCPMDHPRQIGVVIPKQPVHWVGGASDATWTNAPNWDNNLPPASNLDYFVNNAVINDPGLNDDTANVTYTFEGDSLTISNGSTLFLYKNNPGGWDNVYEYINNLTIMNSTLKQRPPRNTKHYIETPIDFEGDCDVYFRGGAYGGHIALRDGMTGSGSIYVHRYETGSYDGGLDAANSTSLELTSGDFSGYSGNWLVEGNPARDGYVTYLHAMTAGGWGTGNMTAGNLSHLYLGASVDASQSILTVNTNAVLDIADNTTSVVHRLYIDSTSVVPAGTYSVTQLDELAQFTTVVGGTTSNGVLRVLQPTRGLIFTVQ